MSKSPAAIVLLVAMIFVIVVVDVVFLRGSADIVLRLLVNVGIVAVFGAACFAFLRRA